MRGNGIAALHSVPTAIFCVLHCLQPGMPSRELLAWRDNSVQLGPGRDTDTITCMAGAIARGTLASRPSSHG
ncbi:ADP-ribose glycohydrolase ARH3 [Lates japonicus]|uniref:ADP-ribose glycohydrolase ARH3 n=1 Tax=Lates japonicus TaxID=270547 RepID=A0AAD3R572_LATJO|nr:ADP-ribose glycohydrolase ARH3 [Lates japonicus]